LASVEIEHMLQIQFLVVMLAVASVLVLIIMDRFILRRKSDSIFEWKMKR